MLFRCIFVGAIISQKSISAGLAYTVQKNMAVPNAIFVDCHHGNESWKDLFLMSCCHHNIIANSTFSFWAAMLNPRPDKMVIYPQRWFYWKTPDIFPDSWIPVTEKEIKGGIGSE